MRKLYITFIALFFAIISLPAVFVFTGNDKDFSENENRMLQTAPEFSLDSALSGSFQEKLTSYISDQFPTRDTWTGLGTEVKKLAGFKDIGGAYLGNDGYYMEKLTPESINDKSFRSNLEVVDEFAQNNTKASVTLLLVPATGTVMDDKLPAHAQIYDAEMLWNTAGATLKNVNVPNLYACLRENKAEQIYYRTDHHWTWYGAYAAYRLLQPDGAYSASAELLSDKFLGTTYSKTLDSEAKPDKLFISPVSEDITVTADGKAIALYDMAAKSEKDKYKVFFGGNYGQVVINGGCDNGKTLLIIKDSFANSLAPFLTADYETIIMLDMRYYTGSAQRVVNENEVDDILFVQEMSSFANDKSLVKLTFG